MPLISIIFMAFYAAIMTTSQYPVENLLLATRRPAKVLIAVVS